MPTIHNLKTWPEYFKEVRSKAKTFEVRENDRGFKVGDLLVLHEYAPQSKSYTGEAEIRAVSYLLEGGEFGISEGFCVMGLQEIT
jgi:hypothetical protein